jgi:hypothetical protein
MRLTVRTVSVVPAGIVAAKEDAIQAQLEIAIRRNVFLVIYFFGVVSLFGVLERVNKCFV